MKFPAKQLLAVAAVFGSGLGVSLGAAAATLNIVGCDSFSGDPTTGTITCVTGSTTPPSPLPGAPSGCTASVAPTSLPATGGQVNLATASCTGGTLDDSMTKLKRNGVVVSRPDTLPSNSASSTSARYTYSAQFCTSDGTCGADVGAGTVTVAAGVATPPPSTGSCGNLKVINRFAVDTTGEVTSNPLTFDQARYITSGFDGASVAVATIKVPAGVTGSTSVEVREYGAQITGRRMWLSKTICDFSATGRYYGAGPSVKLPAWFGTSNPDPTRYALMQPGETWYVMVKNESIGYFGVTNTCKTGGCEASIKAGFISP